MGTAEADPNDTAAAILVFCKAESICFLCYTRKLERWHYVSKNDECAIVDERNRKHGYCTRERCYRSLKWKQNVHRPEARRERSRARSRSQHRHRRGDERRMRLSATKFEARHLSAQRLADWSRRSTSAALITTPTHHPTASPSTSAHAALATPLPPTQPPEADVRPLQPSAPPISPPSPAEQAPQPPLAPARSASPHTDQEEGVCVICCSNASTHACAPCGHQCLCVTCELRVRDDGRCPLCRNEIILCMRVYR